MFGFIAVYGHHQVVCGKQSWTWTVGRLTAPVDSTRSNIHMWKTQILIWLFFCVPIMLLGSHPPSSSEKSLKPKGTEKICSSQWGAFTSKQKYDAASTGRWYGAWGMWSPWSNSTGKSSHHEQFWEKKGFIIFFGGFFFSLSYFLFVFFMHQPLVFWQSQSCVRKNLQKLNSSEVTYTLSDTQENKKNPKKNE